MVFDEEKTIKGGFTPNPKKIKEKNIGWSYTQI